MDCKLTHPASDSEKGSILVIALVYFVVFSMTGVLFLQLADRMRLNSVNMVHDFKNQWAVESAISKAIWRTNILPDSLVNFQEDSLSVQYDKAALAITVSTTKWNRPYGVRIELFLDHLFNNTFYTTTAIDTNDPAITILSENITAVQAPTLPALDTAYYVSHAVAVYNNGKIFNAPMTPGIHYIRSGQVELKNNTSLVGTLVSMGPLKVTGTNVVLTAGTDSAGAYLPALIVADSVSSTSITAITINGAIICYGTFDLVQGQITGPFIGSELNAQVSLTIDDNGSDQYYTYYAGFTPPDTTAVLKVIKKGTWSQTL